MKTISHVIGKKLLVSAISLALPVMAVAAPSLNDLQNEIDALKVQLTTLNTDVKEANEWKNPNTLVHMSGYADVGFSKSDASGDDGSFSVGTFAPIFHYQYRDLVMLESEPEFEVGDDGATEIKLEYLTIDWFINDNVALVAGQFLSPIGQFRQNLHPSWINKLPTAPPGFGHDGAAPVSDLGVQLRGGFHVGGMKANYAVYMGNGPEIKAEIELDPADVTNNTIEEIEYDGVEAEAFGADRDGEKVFGGRIALFPITSVEVGVSLLTGKATVTEYEDGDPTASGTAPALPGASASDYDVTGIDVSWNGGDMGARYEYVKSEVGKTMLGTFDLDETEWTTWYAQYSYKLQPTKYELVVRYTDFDSPHASSDMQQSAVGVNYLFTNNFIGKFGYESNDNPNAGFSVDNRWLLQLAYGF